MSQTAKTILISILCSIAVMFTLSNWMGWNHHGETVAKQESVYDRVMRTKTLRCGYVLRPGFLIKDINTGEFTGIAHDYVEELAKSLSLKIEWAEEIGSGDIATALQSGRVDAQCSAIWPTSARARAMDFISPIALTPLVAVVRNNETRFNGDYAQLNDSQYSAAYVDGSTMGVVTNRSFGLAQPHSLPQLSALTEPLVDVVNGKADFALSDSYVAHDFMEKNPGKLKILSSQPIGVYTNALFIKQDEYKFKRMLDSATEELIGTGAIDHIIQKYQKYPGTIMPIHVTTGQN